MSLTSVLKGASTFSGEFHAIFNDFNFNIEDLSKEILNTDIKARFVLRDYRLAGLTGGAFDYLSRFIIAKNQFRLTKVSPSGLYDFSAEKGLKILLENTQKPNNGYEEIFNTGLLLIIEFVEKDEGNSKALFERVLGVSVYFAKLEQIYRSGYKIELENTLSYRIDGSVRQELINQITIMEEVFNATFNINTTPSRLNYNPSFGLCALVIGGADADIVINDTLIDFKTTKNLKNIKNDLEQVFFYYLFSKLLNKYPDYNILDEEELVVNSISLYYSRFGKFVTYNFTTEDKKKIEKAMNRLKTVLKI